MTVMMMAMGVSGSEHQAISIANANGEKVHPGLDRIAALVYD